MIKNIKIKNICTIADFDMDLSSINVAMVVGESGSGKTTLLGSIFACIYGSFPDKPERTLYEDVKNQEQTGEIEIVLEIGNDSYRIQRLVEAKERKNYAYVYDKDDNLIAGPQIKGFESWIKDNIMDRNMFLALHYLSQKRKNDICDLPPSTSSLVSIGLLGLGKFYDSSKKFQDIAKTANSNLVFIENQFSQIRDAKSRLPVITKRKDDTYKWINDATEELEKLDTFIKGVNTEYLSKLESKKSELMGQISSLNSESTTLRKQRKEIAEQLALTKKAGCKTGSTYKYPKCPLLNIDRLSNRDKDLLLQIGRNSRAITKLEAEVNSVEVELQELIERDKEGILSKKILAIEEKKQLTQEITIKNRELGAIENEISNIGTVLAKEAVLNKERKEYKEQAQYSDFLYRAFGKKGAPSLVMEDAFNEINKIANNICIEYFVPFRFAISFMNEEGDESILGPLNIMLVDDTGRSRHVTSYSGGESQLAQIILRFAIQDYLVTNLNHSKLDMFIGDEPWSEQDSNLAEITHNIINDHSRFGQILVVSHDTTFCSKFDNIIEVKKGEKGTSICLIPT